MKQTHCAANAFRAFVVIAIVQVALIFDPFSFAGGGPSEAAESGQPPSSSVVVVETGYPAEKPAEAQTDTRNVTVGDGSLPPVPVRVVRRTASGDVTTQQSFPLAEPVPSEPTSAPSPETPAGVVTEVPTSDVSMTIPRPTATTGAEVGRWQPRNKAVIVRDASLLLDPNRREDSLTRIVQGKFTRVLLSFAPSGLETVSTSEGTQQLHNLLRSAAEKNLTVDLLLKTPEQPSAAEWKNVDALLEFFRPFPFRSVALDLSSIAGSAAAEQLVSVLESAVAASGRPVGVLVDPRILEGGFGDFIASAFYRLNLNEVAPVIYSTNAEEVAARFQAICRFYVDLPFSLVQSIDDNRPRTESYFTAGVTIFGRRMQKLCFDTAASNAQDLIVDAFENYLRMEP